MSEAPEMMQEQRAASASRRRAIKVVFVIRSLELAGAERQLVELARSLDTNEFAPTVLTCYGGGTLEAELTDAGVPQICLEKQGRWDNLGFLRRLRRSLRQLAPDILHSYMTTANIFALAARSAVPQARLVWGVRQSNFEGGAYGFPLGALFAASLPLERRLARAADLIIPNSRAAADLLASAAVPRDKIEVVPNGVDCTRFQPDPTARTALRGELGVAEGVPLVGLVGRIDPMKGHAVFLEAAARLCETRRDIRFVCVGEMREPLASELRKRAHELGLAERVIWAGERQDMPQLYNALDAHVSASLFGEGFSNAVAEAMAASVPSVVTDVGDSAMLVGDCGKVVPANDPAALAGGLNELLDLADADRRELARRCRDRIAKDYSREAMVAHTAGIYRRLAGQAKPAAQGS